MTKHLITLGITILLILVVGLSGCNEETLSDEPKTIYVDDDGGKDYTTIQDAIDNATDGDTVFVYNGTYQENVVVDKSINLISEYRDTTVIDGGRSDELENQEEHKHDHDEDEHEDVVFVSADWVTIHGFTIRNGGNDGIDIRSNRNTITGNNILNNYEGVYIGKDSKNNHVSWNTISDNVYGIYTDGSFNNNISKNNISLSIFDGIHLHGSDNNIISGNSVSDNKFNGIRIKQSDHNTVFGNLVVMNPTGVYCCCGAENNIIYSNNFKQNSEWNARDATPPTVNHWDNGSIGNYWDDYTEKYPNATQVDGIWDTPYNITDGDINDRFPLVNPYVYAGTDTNSQSNQNKSKSE